LKATAVIFIFVKSAFVGFIVLMLRISITMELLGTVVSSPVLRKVGTIMLWNGLERMAVMN
jgi:hypothetical protein